MTLLAILLKRRYFDRKISLKLAYATLGLLFVNISIGGTLTHFAAPPVLMVASKWHWDTVFMLTHLGWKAAASCFVSTALVAFVFRKELLNPSKRSTSKQIPSSLATLAHLGFLGAVVGFAHHPDVFFGVFMLFLGLVTATKEYQDGLKLKEGLLVGFFLAGLVTLGSLQAWWLKPLIAGMDGATLYFGATGLTAVTDNAALDSLRFARGRHHAGSSIRPCRRRGDGGGLTVIANAPNPAGAGILQSAKVFRSEGISPLGLFLGALPPTAIAILFFWFAP